MELYLGEPKQKQRMELIFHLKALVTYEVRETFYDFVATIKTFGRVLNLFWSLSPLFFFVSYF